MLSVKSTPTTPSKSLNLKNIELKLAHKNCDREKGGKITRVNETMQSINEIQCPKFTQTAIQDVYSHRLVLS